MRLNITYGGKGRKEIQAFEGENAIEEEINISEFVIAGSWDESKLLTKLSQKMTDYINRKTASDDNLKRIKIPIVSGCWYKYYWNASATTDYHLDETRKSSKTKSDISSHANNHNVDTLKRRNNIKHGGNTTYNTMVEQV
ncbi:hypothetical protein H5410_053199 [Solanum commersonii]|uniref:Uncharacterized protein n=1 Tax=Solanum commersonii TaxID=4109 RepID=A0A9J5X5L9_SOLCO|nr:hypothetical protein H5410_053199 [Solanum commersonii]